MPVTPGPATPTSAGLVRIDQPQSGIPTVLTPQSLGTPVGLGGVQQATRYVGGTTSGAPTSGSFLVGDFVIDQTGALWVCIAAGSPGFWVEVAGNLESGPAATSVPDPTVMPSLVATSPSPATALVAGTYHVGYCYTTAQGGRTKLSPTAAITIAAGQGIQALAPMLPLGATGIEFYVDDCVPSGIGDSASGGVSYGTTSSGSGSGGVYYGTTVSGSASGGVTYP